MRRSILRKIETFTLPSLTHKMKEKDMRHSETTPLLEVNVAPPRHRYPHHALRRACTMCLAALLSVATLLFLLPTSILPREGGSIWSYLPGANPIPHKAWPESYGLPYEQLQQILLNVPSAAKAREWSQYYTAGPHLGGKNLSQALWTLEKWKEFGVEDTGLATYDIYINYPLEHRLALLKKSGDKTEVTFEATLEEDVLEEDPTSGLPDRVPVFHGYSASGNVTAQYVYVNFGTYKDFEDLVNANITLKGKIAIAKYGGIFRGLKVKRAQELGMVGVVIYSDPQEDGEITEENGYEAYPNGPARNPSAIQRGSTQFLSILPGDPTTPGYASKPGCERQDPHNSIPSIPSLPISYKEVLPFLKALNGHGPKASDFNEFWQGGGLGYKGVEYNIGPSPEDVVINLHNLQEYVTTPLWNVIGTIKGHISDEVVVLGNHRDAWIAGGAGDPNSGSAALNEVVRSFGEALKAGWRPLRTVVFASWDGEEYGLLGSTEWVEEYLPWLSKTNIAYLNVDVAAAGTHFEPRASPLLNKVINDVTALVQSPNQTVRGQTIRDVWDGKISTMGSGSDFTAFQDFAGVASLDFGFGRSKNDPVYHYHSNYDSFAWMEKYGDKDFLYHQACAKLWALAAAQLVESPLLALNATDYSLGLGSYLDHIKPAADNLPEKIHFDFAPLDRAIFEFQESAKAFDAHAADLESQLGDDVPWYQWWKKVRLLFQIRVTNAKYKGIERAFLYQPGLDGREWFKHVVFAPGIWTGYSGATYPGLVESLEAGDVENAEKWSSIIQERIGAATKLLL
ncbi:Glutamate carboxypeptidase, putative [Penicillium digitatum]|nr:Glutamate carboxypeptidase, putative [Penicillium digitatum]